MAGTEEKFCNCQNETTWDAMIQCDAEDGCGEWYHFECEKLNEACVAHIITYAWRGCVKEKVARTTWLYVDEQPGTADASSDISSSSIYTGSSNHSSSAASSSSASSSSAASSIASGSSSPSSSASER